MNVTTVSQIRDSRARHCANRRELRPRFEDADDQIAVLERLIAKKQAIKQGMMQQLLTGQAPVCPDSLSRVRALD